MKKPMIFLSFALLYCTCLLAQSSKVFPTLAGETLSDKKVVLPNDTKGKFSLVGMAYSKGAEEELKSWFQPVYSTFIEKTKGLFEENYDINLYFVPMFTGVNQAAEQTAKSKTKQNLDKALHPYVLFYKGDLKPYKDALDFEKKDTPYIYVLDPEGKIIYSTSGKFSKDKLKKIESALGADEE
ncbi:MAG TPA: hypothetical protein VF691_22115 [Cytophagaceae bacterium]|jgi:hypothetical protein